MSAYSVGFHLLFNSHVSELHGPLHPTSPSPLLKKPWPSGQEAAGFTFSEEHTGFGKELPPRHTTNPFGTKD